MVPLVPLNSPTLLTLSQSIHPIPPLLSPIQLHPRPLRSQPTPKSRPRRVSPPAQHRRRRHCQRDCHFETVGAAHFFDQIPWISAMENANFQHHRDIADLSQLDPLPSSSGPVRRRKTSPRSNPLASPKDLPFPAPPQPASNPQTPLSNLSLATVRFNHLIPVFSPTDSLNRDFIRNIFDTD